MAPAVPNVEMFVLGEGPAAARLLFAGDRCEVRVRGKIITGGADFALVARCGAEATESAYAALHARLAGDATAASAAVDRLITDLEPLGIERAAWEHARQHPTTSQANR